jgi:putative peptide zinc metalloprotease protein
MERFGMEKIYQSSAEKDANSNIWLDIEQKSAKSPVQAAAPDDIWQLTEGRLNHAKYKPVKIPDAEVADVSTKAGEARYALRNPHNDKYIIIGDEELFLWNLIDGQNTVKDIALEYITRYDALGSELLMDLLDALRNDGFLEEQPVSVFQSLKDHFHKDTLSAAAMSVVVFFVHGILTTRKADSYFTWLYKHFAHVFFTRLMLIFGIFLFLADIILYVHFFLIRHNGLLITFSSTSHHVYDDFILLMLVFFLSVLIHEHAHALTVKKYERKILRGGVMLYFGMPLAFVDTTDIWMKPKWARIAVSFAGPFSNALLGGLFFSIALFLPDTILRSIFLQAAILNTTLFFINLLPIAETDGHYIIQDYLEMPRLRTQALSFIKSGMWQKLARRERWEKNDFIFFLYGLIFIAGVIFTLYLGLHFWITTMEHLFKAALLRPALVLEILGVLVTIMIIFIIIRLFLLWSKRASNINNLLQSRIESG